MPKGTVKWFNSTKGFGFIQPDAGGKDVFLHVSAVERAGLQPPADGRKVSYELETGRDGRTSAGNTHTTSSTTSAARWWRPAVRSPTCSPRTRKSPST